MKKQIAAVALGLVCALSLGSCAKEVSFEEVSKQAATYDQAAVNEKYSGGTATIEQNISTSTGIFALVFTKGTTSKTAPFSTTVVTGVEISDATSEYKSENIHYYLDGSAISFKAEFSGNTTYSTLNVTAKLKLEYKYTSEGLYSYSYTEVSYDDGNSNTLSMNVKTNVTWATK
ncbi:MAG: hypothetical protein WCR67_01565 [Bacilli bacterium]